MWLYSKPPSVVRRAWPQSCVQFLAPVFVGFGFRGDKRSRSYVVREGHRFEGKLLDALATPAAESAGWHLLPEFCFSYTKPCGSKTKAYIDILAINPKLGLIYVLEAKRSHVAESYKQIWKYMSLVRSAYPDYNVIGFEICLYQGLSLEYPGPHRWMSPGVISGNVWDGYGQPTVSIVPWYLGQFFLPLV